ncbi:glutamate--cysteine ligase [Dactylosporangium vinaceum]|uniref:Glutamate-cysteine ligase family protein n=1 Tax=Dactylosporangium vinaceum TaxID=53362 RepID=A0ABV5M4V5_9ACTN|nr:glutamate-cysteine ligase family protein [Dactylosporangium vinaceum]UAB96045.1 glutamate--cysteine ligase [Dactylosporangium vinaceum]
MGKDVESTVFSREDRTRYRDKVHRCLDAFARMLDEATFEDGDGMSGLEIELNLVDERYDPALRNQRVLDAMADPAFVTELGQFNIEINVPPQHLAGDGLARFEEQVRTSLNAAEKHAAQVDTRLAMIGILPTLRRDQLTPDVLSANPRYALLNEQIFAVRGEDLMIAIDGVERLHVRCDSIAPEAACTSVQFHLQVLPQQFAAYWNAAQAIAAVQVALGANSPYLFGQELWRETRIPLFEQATDTRAEELKSQGVRPRVWFGERWITSIFDLFEENVRYFPSLLPICEDEDPIDVLDRGAAPRLGELKLHNGTIYRWNRPIYDVVEGRPHVRVENRVLPAGPTVVDSMANAAFYFGLVHRLAGQERPVWTQMSFGAAEENFHTAARHGIESSVFWPGLGAVPVTELVLRRLLPMAHEGLDEWGVDPAQRDRLLGIIEHRCLAHRNGASWLVEAAHAIEGNGPVERDDTMRKLLAEYLPRMHSNVPVHEW